jgi:hypothetical protein
LAFGVTLACTIGVVCVNLDVEWLNNLFAFAATAVEYAAGGHNDALRPWTQNL